MLALFLFCQNEVGEIITLARAKLHRSNCALSARAVFYKSRWKNVDRAVTYGDALQHEKLEKPRKRDISESA